MYFAVNPWAPDVLDSLIRATQTATRADTRHVFLLLDGAFDETFLSRSPWRQSKRHALYDTTSLAELGRVGLWLIELPAEPAALHAVLLELHAQADGVPMWSLLVSAEPAEVLALHLRPCLVARTTDGLEWPVRWGDARMLPHLIHSLTPAELASMTAPLTAWLYVARDGRVTAVDVGAATSEPPAMAPYWAIDEQHFNALVDAGEADHIISNIGDTRPDLLKMDAPADIHQRVKDCIALANHGGIEAAPARQALAMLGLMLAPHFKQHPAFVNLLEQTRQGVAYEQALRALPDLFWAECERSHNLQTAA